MKIIKDCFWAIIVFITMYLIGIVVSFLINIVGNITDWYSNWLFIPELTFLKILFSIVIGFTFVAFLIRMLSGLLNVFCAYLIISLNKFFYHKKVFKYAIYLISFCYSVSFLIDIWTGKFEPNFFHQSFVALLLSGIVLNIYGTICLLASEEKN